MDGVTKRLRVTQNAQTSGSSAVAPVARSVCAILIAIGVKDEHLDGVMGILADPEIFPEDSAPRNFFEIAQQVRKAHALFLEELDKSVKGFTEYVEGSVADG